MASESEVFFSRTTGITLQCFWILDTLSAVFASSRCLRVTEQEFLVLVSSLCILEDIKCHVLPSSRRQDSSFTLMCYGSYILIILWAIFSHTSLWNPFHKVYAWCRCYGEFHGWNWNFSSGAAGVHSSLRVTACAHPNIPCSGLERIPNIPSNIPSSNVANPSFHPLLLVTYWLLMSPLTNNRFPMGAKEEMKFTVRALLKTNSKATVIICFVLS